MLGPPTLTRPVFTLIEWFTLVQILALGGAGIVLGLFTYGYNIMRALGVKMAKVWKYTF